MILIGQFDSPFVRRVAITMRLYGIVFEHRPWSTFGDAERIAAYNPLRRVPTLVLVVAGVVPLLPGLSVYRGLAHLSAGRATGLVELINASVILLALAAGVIFGEYIAQPLRREGRRLEQRLSGPRLVGPLTVRSVRKKRASRQ